MEGLERPEFPPLGPFATLYEEWIGAYPRPRDPQIEGRLAATYRDAWAGGEPMEQLYVLYFLSDSPQADEVPLILDALGGEDSRVAGHAAIMATHLLLEDRDLGPDVVERFRALALRHPMEDLMRMPRLRRPGDGWPAGRPFIELYERWMSDDFPRDTGVEQQLATVYEQVWNDGDAVDRAYVLHFLGHRRGDSRPGLVLEGLRSDDYRLARTAMFWLHYEIEAGHELGPEIRDVIREHVRRFPDSYTLAVGAFLDLNKREGKEPAS